MHDNTQIDHITNYKRVAGFYLFERNNARKEPKTNTIFFYKHNTLIITSIKVLFTVFWFMRAPLSKET